MATITTTGSGNWNSTTPNAPWPGGTVPAATDLVRIGDGHTLTVPSGYTAECGDYTGAVALAGASNTGTGVLVVNGTLRFKGPVEQPKPTAGVTWTVNAGGVLEHDSSGAGTPATTNYIWQIGKVATGGATKLRLAGTAGVRVILRNRAGSGNCGGFSNGATTGRIGQDTSTFPAGSAHGCGLVQASYVTGANWGTATMDLCTTYLFNYGPADDTVGIYGMQTYWDNCLLNNCGNIMILGAFQANSSFRFKRTRIENPLNSFGNSIIHDGQSASSIYTDPTATRFEECYIEGCVQGDTGAQNLLRSWFLGTATKPPMLSPNIANQAVNSSDACVWLNRVTGGGTSSSIPTGTHTRLIALASSAVAVNPHFITFLAAGNTTITGWLAEYNNSSVDGDIFQPSGNPASTKTFAATYGLALPNTIGEGSGTGVNLSAAAVANWRITTDHNTHYSGSSVGLVYHENNAIGAGVWQSAKNNLTLCKASAGYVQKHAGATPPGAGSFVGVDYNGKFNPAAGGGSTSGYEAADSAFSTPTPPGPHDVVANPNMVDDTRNVLKWAQSVDAAVTSWGDLLTRVKASLDEATAGTYSSTFDPANAAIAMYDWIRAGHSPTNTAVGASASSDATYLGAVPLTALGPTPQQKLFYRRLQYAASIAALALSHVLSFFGARHV